MSKIQIEWYFLKHNLEFRFRKYHNKFRDNLWSFIYWSEGFIFCTCLRMNEVPLWADRIRWFLERHYLSYEE